MRTQHVLPCLALLVALVPARLPAQGPDGKALYEKSCRACHGPRGIPPTTLAKQMNIPALDSAFFAGRSDVAIVQVIKRGGKKMKGFEGRMSPPEMAAIATYLRQAFGTPKAKP